MPDLKHRNEFEKVLQNYMPSDDALELVRAHPLVLLLGVSGAGRNTIINHLVNEDKYHFIISDTTRSPKLRDGRLEQDGQHYNFKTEEDFLSNLNAGKYLEAEIIHDLQVSGISIAEFSKALASNKIPINEVDLGGVEAIKRVKPDVMLFFMVPPTYKEWMFRLRGREIMSKSEESKRLNTARKILVSALNNDDFVFVVNTSSHKTAERLDTYVNGANSSEEDKEARIIAHAILNELTSGTH